MTSAAAILETVSASGGQLWLVDGERLRYRLPERLAPLVEEIREHKPELIELLEQRPAMPAGVRLLRYAPATPPVRLSRYETVIDPERFIRTTLAQIDARLHSRNWLAGNWSLSGLLERLSAVGCIVTLDDRRAMLQ